MQECLSASNHEIQPTNLKQLKTTTAKILEPLSTEIPKHKDLSHMFQTVPNQHL
jgi:hypothetical protein